MPPRSALLFVVHSCLVAGCAHFDRPAESSRSQVADRVVPAVATRATPGGAESDQSLIEVSRTAGDQPAAAAPIRLTAFSPEPAVVEADLPPAPAPGPGYAGNVDADPAVVPPPGAYTLDDFERLALQHNPTLRQAAAVVGKARGVHRQVGLYPNPTIGYQASEVGNEGQAGQQGAFIGQTIVTGDKLDLSRSVTSWEIQSTQWEAEAQRLRVVNGVRSRFYQALGAQRRAEIARRLVSVAESGLRAAEQLQEAKEVGRPDVLQARIQLNEVRVALRNAEADAEAAWRQLGAVVGCPDLPRCGLAGDLDGATREWNPDMLIAELCGASPELHAARARVARAGAQIRRQQAQPIPNVELQFGGAHDFSTGDPIANVQVGLPIPVFNRNQGNIDAARAEYRQALADVRRVELDLRSRAAAAFRDYRQAASQVELYRGEILPAAEENLELTEAGYERGEFDLLRALTARRSYFEANLALVGSQVALRQADVALSGLLLSDGLSAPPDSAAGTPLDTGLRDQSISGE